MSRRNRKRGLRRNTTGRGRSVLCHEPLEDRRLLAVVTSAADAGPGSLRDALASGDASITFDTAMMGSSTITLSSSLTVASGVSIDGNDGGGGRVTVDADGSGAVFLINDGDNLSLSDVTISNMIITGGNSTDRGGGIQTAENLTIDFVALEGNTTATDGGGISGVLVADIGNSLTILNSSISNNSALDDGAAIDLLNGGSLTITNSIIDGNVGGGAGIANSSIQGVVRLTGTSIAGAELRVTGSQITNNSISGTGVTGATSFFTASGLQAFSPAVFEVTDSVITGNSIIIEDLADPGDQFSTIARGGGIYAQNAASVNITNTIVSNNSIISEGPNGVTAGAGISVFGLSDVTLTGSTLNGNISRSQNTAGATVTPFSSGGGLNFIGATDESSLTVTNSTISGNTADSVSGGGGRGGAIYAASVPSIDVKDSIVDDNYSYSLGGAFNIGGSTRDVVFNMDNTTMSRNGFEVGGGNTISGGAIELISFSTTFSVTGNISNSTFTDNVATFGGGIRFQQGAGGTVTDSTFTGNEAYAGGAINFAADNRDGIVLNIDSTTISGNSATASGGGISTNAIGARSFAQTLNITNSTISGNTQAGVVTADYYGDGGGGIALTDGTILNLSGSTVTGNTATNGVDDDTMTETPVAGGGILIGALNLAAGASVVNMNGSIVSGNTIVGTLGTESAFGFDIGDVDGGITGLYPARTTTSFSIVGVAEGSGLIAANPDGSGNKIGTVASPLDAMLNPLADNGGPTFTHLPMLGSPAIDMGDPASTLTVDQRGGARPFNGTVDIGSVEVGADVGPDCDLNGDGACDTADLRVLYDNIAGGSATNADIAVWLADAGAFNSKTYVPGDTNLDGEVGGGDFTALASSFGASGLPGAYWDQGNFDGNDGGAFSVGGGDFTALASNFGFMSPVAARANGHDGTGLERRSISSRDSAGSHMAIADFEREVETTSTPDRQEKFVPRAAANIEGRRVIVSTEVEEKSVVVDQFVPLQSVNKIAETSDDRLRVSRSANVDRVFAEFELA